MVSFGRVHSSTQLTFCPQPSRKRTPQLSSAFISIWTSPPMFLVQISFSSSVSCISHQCWFDQRASGFLLSSVPALCSAFDQCLPRACKRVPLPLLDITKFHAGKLRVTLFRKLLLSRYRIASSLCTLSPSISMYGATSSTNSVISLLEVNGPRRCRTSQDAPVCSRWLLQSTRY